MQRSIGLSDFQWQLERVLLKNRFFCFYGIFLREMQVLAFCTKYHWKLLLISEFMALRNLYNYALLKYFFLTLSCISPVSQSIEVSK
mgnify:CR=1 FL=1